MDFLTSVAAASEFITGVKVTEATRDQDVAKLTTILGKPPDYTDKGRQLASVQVQISGGPRPSRSKGSAVALHRQRQHDRRREGQRNLEPGRLEQRRPLRDR